MSARGRAVTLQEMQSPPPRRAGRRRAHHLVVGVGDGIAGTVYGTVIAMAAVAAGSAGGTPPGRLAALVAATVVLVWVAHVYAHGLAESIARGRRVDAEELWSLSRRELPIALAAVAPVSALVLGALGVLTARVAVWLALGVCLVALVVQGVRYARVEALGRTEKFAVVVANLALGLLVVALKAAVVH
jgi:hypothetical protein